MAPWTPYAGLLTGAVLVLVGAIGYGLYWQWQPAGRPADTAVVAFWQGLLRYAVASAEWEQAAVPPFQVR